MRIFRLALPLTVAFTLMVATIASAATTYNDSIRGYEYFATSTVGSFAGTASGDLPGAFDAQIVHTVLTTTATITGGAFTLYTVIGNTAAVVVGNVASGTVRQIDTNTHGCRDQHYAVTGTLDNVTVNGTGAGTGSFSATLTHYRVRIGSECITYSASIAGGISLTV